MFKVNLENGISDSKCIFKGEKYRITILSDVLIRLEYNEKGVFNDNPTLRVLNRKFSNMPKFTIKEDNKFLNISNEYFILEYSKNKSFNAPKLTPDANLRITLVGTDKVWYFNHPEARNFYGSAYNLDTKDGRLKFEKGLYSTDGFCSIDDSLLPVFDEFGDVKKNPSNGLDIYVFMYRKDFNKCLNSYYELTGFPAMIPRYSLGIWWNRSKEYSQKDISELVLKFNKRGLPLSSVVLGNDWHSKNVINGKKVSSGFTFNSELFNDVNELSKELHSKNVFLGTKINTLDGVSSSEENYKVLSDSLGVNDNRVIPINVYNSKVINSFFDSIIKPIMSNGVDLLWISDDLVDRNKLFLLNHYSFKFTEEVMNRRGMIMSRNPNIAAHRYPVLYSGDTRVSFKTLKNLPFFNSTASNMGVSWWSHDIGGFKDGTENSELYIRYVQLGVYSPIFRFASGSGKYYKREPWLWDVKTEKIVHDYMRVRHMLIPYIYTEAYKYHKQGMPLITPIYYGYPSIYDEPMYKNQYFFGSELLVCPITESADNVMKRNVVRLYMPDGVWYDFKTGKKFPGNKRYITFYKDEDYPVFAKNGSIVPMAILDDNDLNNTKAPKGMEVHIFPGKSNSYQLYEDDGVSNIYKDGYYIITNIDYNYRANNYTVIIRPVEGKSGLITEFRDYKIRFRNTKYAEDVRVNVGREPVEFNKYVDDADFVVEVKNVSTIQQLTINCAGNDIEIDAVRLINDEIDAILSDIDLETNVKEKISDIIFSDMEIRRKRIEIKKLRGSKLNTVYIKMFMRLLEYIAEI